MCASGCVNREIDTETVKMRNAETTQTIHNRRSIFVFSYFCFIVVVVVVCPSNVVSRCATQKFFFFNRNWISVRSSGWRHFHLCTFVCVGLNGYTAHFPLDYVCVCVCLCVHHGISIFYFIYSFDVIDTAVVATGCYLRCCCSFQFRIGTSGSASSSSGTIIPAFIIYWEKFVRLHSIMLHPCVWVWVYVNVFLICVCVCPLCPIHIFLVMCNVHVIFMNEPHSTGMVPHCIQYIWIWNALLLLLLFQEFRQSLWRNTEFNSHGFLFDEW